MVLELIQREIALRGDGYIILRDCPEDRLGEALGRGMEKLKRAGAKRVLATSLPEGEPLNSGPIGVWRLTHSYDILWLERPLTALPKPELKLATKPLKKSLDDKCWLEAVNRSFQNVPNARTRTGSELRRPNRRCGLGWAADKFVGAYEVDLTDSKVPELATLAISPEFQRQGYGKALLVTLLNGMRRMEKCVVRISTRNEPAVSLCESVGFVRTGVESSWFEVV